ncbi:MAG TPA: PQQ-binding-like beta-propeller repeat protein [Rhizomicrobium sp.]|nr:PQQ-binding-like beta-propeller repeat protein [Rhizomicrobium sp.]
MTIAGENMTKISTTLSLAVLTAFIPPAAAQELAPMPRTRPEPPPVFKQIEPGPAVPDWLSYNYDRERSGWNRGETVLGKKTVGKLKPLWNRQLLTDAPALVLSTLTAPVVVAGVSTPAGAKDLLFTIGMDDTLTALDANTGETVWQKHFDNPLKPLRPRSISCANTEQATPIIDKASSHIYFTTSDGKLRGAKLGDGAEALAPTDMVQPYSRNWSLNLVDNVIYTTAARGCGGGPTQPMEFGTVAAMDISDPAHPALSRFYTGKGRPAGPWGASGVAWGPQGAYVATADGPNNPGSGIYGDMILAVRPHAWGLNDSFTPSNWRYVNARDLDIGSGGVLLFPFGKRNILATASKESVVFLLDADNLGGFDHMTALYQSPRLGNDSQDFQAQGVWGNLATAQSETGERWIYVPLWGAPAKAGLKFPIANGDAPDGSIMALKVVEDQGKVSLQPQWVSRDLNIASPPVVANGVVYALQTAESAVQVPKDIFNPDGTRKPWASDQGANNRIMTPHSVMSLFAFDAETGKELWSSGKTMDGNAVHFTQPVVALGKLFAVDHAGHVWAFGLPQPRARK